MEYTFGRARVKVRDVHTLQKFINEIGGMNEQIISKTNEEIEKIKGRTTSFGVTMEDSEEATFEPQLIAMQFLNFINIDNSNDGSDDNFDELFQSIY